MLEPPPRKPDDLDALLSRKRLSGAEYDFIAARVLAGASRKNRAKRIALYALPALAAAAMLMLLVLPRSDGLRAKGARELGPVLELACSSGESARCPQGKLLTFRVEDVKTAGYLHAWAEPVEGGERVWYLEGQGAIPVEARPGTQLLRRAVRIGPQQPPGRYRVRLLLARTRLDRQTLLQGPSGVIAEVTSSLEVTR